jgi:hypothetical protein
MKSVLQQMLIKEPKERISARGILNLSVMKSR